MTKNGVRLQTKQQQNNGVKPTNGPTGGFLPREQYRHHHHHHHYQHQHAGAAYEASIIKKGTQQQVFWRGIPQQQQQHPRTLSSSSSSSGSYGSSSSSSNISGSSSSTVKGVEPMTPTSGGGTETATTAQTPLWTLLPKDLVEKVFAFLPLHSLFQARCVCKCWKNVDFFA